MINTTQLQQACHDILVKNMEYIDQSVYLLYDTESPLAQILSDAWIAVLVRMQNSEQDFSSSTETGLCRNDGHTEQISPFILRSSPIENSSSG
jgi:hypothetical protein